jgi:hypothetical protein
MLTLHASNGRTFRTRLVRIGEHYGLHDCLTHGAKPTDRSEPLIEFYDARYADAPGFGPRGQFITRYYVSTLLDTTPGVALMLHGGEPEWTVDPANMARVRDYLQGVTDALS